MTSSYLPTYRSFPVEKPDELERVLVQTYTEIAEASNVKENAQYETVETVNDQQFYGLVDPQAKRFVYRKCFEIGAIASGATATIAHGIAPLIGFANIYGTCFTDQAPGGDWRPIPYTPTVNEYIAIRVTVTNIIIDVAAASPNVLSGMVVLEYFKN